MAAHGLLTSLSPYSNPPTPQPATQTQFTPSFRHRRGSLSKTTTTGTDEVLLVCHVLRNKAHKPLACWEVMGQNCWDEWLRLRLVHWMGEDIDLMRIMPSKQANGEGSKEQKVKFVLNISPKIKTDERKLQETFLCHVLPIPATWKAKSSFRFSKGKYI